MHARLSTLINRARSGARALARSLMIAGAVVCAGASTARADADTIVHVAPPFPPYALINSSGDPVGRIFEVSEALLDGSGLTIERVIVPPLRVMAGMQSGEYDLAIGPRGFPEVEDAMYIHHTPTQWVTLSLLTRAGLPPAHTIAEMAGGRIALVRNYRYSGLLDRLTSPRATVEIVATPDTPTQIVRMLALGRADYGLIYRGQVDLGTFDATNRPFDHGLQRSPLFIHMDKRRPDWERLVALMLDNHRDLVTAGLLNADGMPSVAFR